MLKKIIMTLLILIVSAYGGDDLEYHSDEDSSLSKLLSYEETKLDDNLYLNVDFFSVLSLVDDENEDELDQPYALKTTNPDEVFVTLTYKF